MSDIMSADWRAGYEKAKREFYYKGFTEGARHEECRLRSWLNDLTDSLGDMLALFDDEGNFREDYQDQASIAIERAEANLKNPSSVALGKLGGKVKSEAKAAAARENGKKGGRPLKLTNPKP